jgi:hypothetical protein
MRAWFLIVAGLAGCAAGNAESGASTLTLRAPGETQEMRITTDGRVAGASFQLQATDAGYRGAVHSQIVELRSDGERIRGVVGDRIVDLHVRVDGDVMGANGLFAGRLGRITATPVSISSSFGPCRYELQGDLRASKYEGSRACMRAPLPFEPASVELPARFGELPADRRAMLLALLLAADASR